MKRIIGIVCFLLSLCCCSPVIDELIDDLTDDFTSQLPWTGDTLLFVRSAQEGLRLNDTTQNGGCAYLATPSAGVQGWRWEFRIRLSFRPSSQNYARFYLVSSAQKLSGELDGYFLQIGGSNKVVSLHRQTGLETVLLAAGRVLPADDSSPDLTLRVERDENGYWSFWSRFEEETDYVLEQQVWDTTFTNSAYAGVYCLYTASRSRGFRFSHIRITDGVETTTEPVGPTDPVLPVDPQPSATLLFNEVMYNNDPAGAEYVELFNPSGESLTLSGLLLEKRKPDGTAISGGSISLVSGSAEPLSVPPGGYICFTKSIERLIERHQVDRSSLVELSKFPSLSNSGGFLQLCNEAGDVIDRCYFGDKAHTAQSSKRIGLSLEKRAPELASDVISNWISAEHSTGGTPGMKNSVVKTR